MGYSSRYHAASLAAVFVALAVGILIGAALGSDVISGTADRLEQDLEQDLDEFRARVSELEGDLEAERALASDLYPAVVGGRLRRQRVALIAFGDVPDGIVGDIEGALGPAGAELAMVTTVREPPNESLELSPRQAGRTLVTGRGRFDELREQLLSRFSGDPTGIDAAIIVRAAAPADEPVDPAVANLERGLIEGMGSTGVTLAGVERSETEPSSIPAFEDFGTASVDNIETLAGKVALVFVLDGVEGAYGAKETAESLLPDLLAPTQLGPKG